MAFEVILSEKAANELRKLAGDVKERIKERLRLAQENPFHYFERLKGRSDYKLRIGDYRVIVDIKAETQRIEVTKVGHRKNIYDNKR